MVSANVTHWHVLTSGSMIDPDGDACTVINAHPCNADLPCTLHGEKPILFMSEPRSYEDGYTAGYDDGVEDASDFDLTHDPFPD